MRHSRTLRTALVGVVLVAGLAGCKIPGMSDPAVKADPSPSAQVELTPQQLVSNATKKSQEASSAKFTMTMKLTTGTTGAISVYGVGQMDDAADAMSMTMKMKVPGLGKQGSQVMRQRLVDGDYYMTGLPTAGKKWVKLDAATAKQFQQGATNPADQLAIFEKLSDGVTEGGTATVNGVQTTKYSGTLDLTKPATADESAELKRARKDFAEAGLTSIPFNYYIDDKGLLARMSMKMDMAKGAAKGTMQLAMNFTDWGAPVSITAPAGAVPLAQLKSAAAPA